MKVDVKLNPRVRNEKLLRSAVITVELNDDEFVALDDDFESRHGDLVRKAFAAEVKGTHEL